MCKLPKRNLLNGIFFVWGKKNFCKNMQQHNEFRIFVIQMDAVFMNSGSSKTSDTHRLLLNLIGKTNLKMSDEYIAFSNFSIYYTWKK